MEDELRADPDVSCTASRANRRLRALGLWCAFIRLLLCGLRCRVQCELGMFNHDAPLSLYHLHPQQSPQHARQHPAFSELPPPAPPPPHPPFSSSSSSPLTSLPPHRSHALRPLTLAVVGCAHGELSSIHTTLAHVSATHRLTIDALLCCGDFQAIRVPSDLSTLACPPHYRRLLPSFPALYFRHTPPPPYLTLYIGGNHENSLLHLQLPYGGWVCDNCYYMGLASVMRLGGWRIGGLSGIWKDADGMAGRWERLPLDNQSLRSVYHVRWFDAWRLLQLAHSNDDSEQKAQHDNDRLAVFMSHDWPRGIAQHGNLQALLRAKPFLREEVEDGSLGNKPAEVLLQTLQPLYWFSAHLHVKYAALYNHNVKTQKAARLAEGAVDSKQGAAAGASIGQSSSPRVTRFLALDKALPNRDYMQIVPLAPHTPSTSSAASVSRRPLRLQYDVDWLCVLRKTAHLTPLTRQRTSLPTTSYRPTEDDRKDVRDRLRAAYRKRTAAGAVAVDEDDEEAMLDVPLLFVPTVREDDTSSTSQPFVRDEQTRALFDMLGVEDTLSAALEQGAVRDGRRAGQWVDGTMQQPPQHTAAVPTTNPDEIDIDCDSEVENGAGMEDEPVGTVVSHGQVGGVHREGGGRTVSAAGVSSNPDEILLDDVDCI